MSRMHRRIALDSHSHAGKVLCVQSPLCLNLHGDIHAAQMSTGKNACHKWQPPLNATLAECSLLKAEDRNLSSS